METDPATVALEGVERFKKQDCDLIIVDTPESHTIEEMRQVFEAVVFQVSHMQWYIYIHRES